MNDTKLTTDQLSDLFNVEKIRLERGQPGLKAEMQAFLLQLKSGGVAGKTSDVREAQAKRLWDLGVGRELGLADYASYLATIPAIPEALSADDQEFPLLALVETRLGLKKLCDLGGIEFNGDDATFIAYDGRHAEFTQPTWIRIQDGRKNRNRAVRACRKTFSKHELGLAVLQGVSAYLQHPQVVSEATKDGAHVMDLPGSVHRGSRGVAADLLLWSGRPRLLWSSATMPIRAAVPRRVGSAGPSDLKPSFLLENLTLGLVRPSFGKAGRFVIMVIESRATRGGSRFAAPEILEGAFAGVRHDRSCRSARYPRGTPCRVSAGSSPE